MTVSLSIFCKFVECSHSAVVVFELPKIYKGIKVSLFIMLPTWKPMCLVGVTD